MPINATGSARYIKGITGTACRKIDEFEETMLDDSMIASLVWQRILPKEEWFLGFGFCKKDDVPECCIVSANGHLIAIGVPETILKNLKYGKIDYQDGRFILL